MNYHDFDFAARGAQIDASLANLDKTLARIKAERIADTPYVDEKARRSVEGGMKLLLDRSLNR